MILLDLSQVLYSTIMAGMRDTNVIDEDFLRHIALNCIRANYHKFKNEYGRLIIATDAKENWRKKIFPYYKLSRARAKNKSLLDWPRIHQIMDTLREELTEYFPYPVIQVDGAEGDDIIAALCFNTPAETILILSEDKDFAQLQFMQNIKQYGPIRKRWIEVNNPVAFLKEHIIRGDASDGIPNILSRDSVFATSGNQGRMTQPRFDMFMTCEPEQYENEHQRNFFRNQQLINLANAPTVLHQAILAATETQTQKNNKGKLFNYFMDKNLKHLMQDIGDF